jgi:hypothetical protein
MLTMTSGRGTLRSEGKEVRVFKGEEGSQFFSEKRETEVLHVIIVNVLLSQRAHY